MRNSHKYKDLDLTNRKVGRLTVVKKVDGTRSQWDCVCECGKHKTVYAWKLVRGLVRSCGCLEKENQIELKRMSTKHGMTDTILYEKWCGMKYRCFNPGYKCYERYGGRGITVCKEWLGVCGFEHFKEWAYEAGYDDSKHGYEQTLDRIDTDGNYCPENCKWSNQTEQVKNRSNAVLIKDTDGEELTSVQFSIKHGIPPKSLFVYRRVKKGMDAFQILKDWEEHEQKK